MNINISKKKSSIQSKKSNLTIGINSRGGGDGTTTGVSHRRPTSAFDDDDDTEHSNDDDDATTPNRSGRDAVNHAIAKQQAAIRAQTSAAAATLKDTTIYDYDGVYDSIHKNSSSSKATTTTTDTTRKSRYIEDLMKTAKVRKMERDIAYDRKVARDQHAEEEAEPEFRKKDRFITSSYKRQLEERNQYEQQESIRQKIEDENDITKRSDGGVGIARFYGNISKQSDSTNDGNHKDIQPPLKDDSTIEDTSHTKEDITSSFHGKNNQHNTLGKRSRQEESNRSSNTNNEQRATTNDSDDLIDARTKIRFLREAKVKAARDRYFQRHNITPIAIE